MFFTLLIVLVYPFTTRAQQYEDAASLQWGSVEVTPTIDLGMQYDDNLVSTADNKTASWSRVISPQLNFQSSLGNNLVTVAYRLRNQDFFDSPQDNFTDHFLIGQLEVEFDARHRLDTKLEYEDGHEARGAGFSIGNGQNLARPDKYRQTEFDTLYTYGAFNSDGRVEINFNIRDLIYDIDTPRYAARGRQLSSLGGTFIYRVGATTDVTFDIRQTEVDYKLALDPNNTLDSTIRQYLVGIQWKATAKTSGFVKVGYEEKDFDSDLREDFGGFDWAAGVVWEPLEYSTFELITGADTNETNGEGNFIRGRTHSIEWRHDWQERLRSRVNLSINNNRYEGELIQGFDIRSDDNRSFNAALYYQFRRWLNFELAYKYSERNSNRTEIDFDRNQFMLNALVTL